MKKAYAYPILLLLLAILLTAIFRIVGVSLSEREFGIREPGDVIIRPINP